MVEAGFHVHGRDGVIVVKVDVVFASPDNFDGLAELLRQDGSFGAEVRLRFAPEPAAQQRDVADYILLVDAQSRRHRILRRLRILDRRPEDTLAVLEVGNGHFRLHGGVGEVRDIILSLQGFGRGGKALVDVAHVSNYLARLACGGLQLLLVFRRGVAGIRARIPNNFQFFAALKGSPSVVGNDGNATQRLKGMRRPEGRDLDCTGNAAHLERILVVKRRELAAQDGRTLYGGVHHAIDFSVHSEGGLTMRDIGKIVDGNVFADIAIF